MPGRLRVALLVGNRYKPSFDSNIDYFTVRGYDEEKDMVLTTIHPRGKSNPFEDSIERKYFEGALETGDYVACGSDKKPDDYPEYSSHLYHLLPDVGIKGVGHANEFTGPCCGRCVNRFGKTMNYCSAHCSDTNCYRFKFDRNS